MLWLTMSPVLAADSGGGRRVSVQRATTRVKAAIVRRDQVERRARARPGFECGAVHQAHEDVDAAWHALANAWRAAPSHTARHADALSTIAAERALDAEHALDFAAWCKGLASVARSPMPIRVEPVKLGSRLIAHGDILEVRVPEGWPKRGTDGQALVEQLSEALADDWSLLLVLVEAGVDPGRGAGASMAIERGIPGLGEAAPWRPAHIPEWKALHGLIVLDGQRGLQGSASLRGVVATFGNRLARPGCEPALGGGWGVSDVGGQLGGGKPGSLRAVSDHWHVSPLFGDRVRGSANGGNAVAYAPIELYLLGLIEPDALPLAQQLANASAVDGGYQATGVCRLDGPTLVETFGRRPLRREPRAVGLVVAAETPLSAARIAEHRRAAAAFFAPGPDDDPFTYNFHEATDGRGRLLLVPARLRGRGPAPTVAQ